jgi:hypothetical protein
VDRLESYAIHEMTPSQWALWLLEWIPVRDGTGQIFGLLATDRPADDRVVIEHRLFAYRPGAPAINRRALCRDAYKPLAFSRQRRELIFSGAEGIYLLNLRGERQRTLPEGAGASGYGAAFDPSGAARVVLGGDGLHLWDLERNQCRRLTRNGRHPVWASDGRSVYYRESSGDLFVYDMKADTTRKVVAIGAQRHPNFWHAGPACLSPCGRYLAVSLTDKVLRGVSRKASVDSRPEKVYIHTHVLVVFDLDTQTYWSRAGYASHLRWAP